MSIKLKLNNAEAERDKIQQEIEDFINDKVLALQKNFNIAIDRISITEGCVKNRCDSTSMPSFEYVESVEIKLKVEEFLKNNID